MGLNPGPFALQAPALSITPWLPGTLCFLFVLVFYLQLFAGLVSSCNKSVNTQSKSAKKKFTQKILESEFFLLKNEDRLLL